MKLLEARALEVGIGGKRVCSQLALGLQPGQCWGVLGPNGAGKTTLLHTLAGLRAPAAGEVLLLEQPLAALRRRRIAQLLGLLPQDSHDALPATVLETALIGRHPFLSTWQWEGAADITRAREALAQVGLRGFESRQIDTLSGGERRRLALATLLTQAPRVYLLDEPTNHLDLQHQIGLLTALKQTVGASEGVILMSLHDINIAARFCDHLLLLFGGGEALAGPAEALLEPDILSRLYGYPIRRLQDGDAVAFIGG